MKSVFQLLIRLSLVASSLVAIGCPRKQDEPSGPAKSGALQTASSRDASPVASAKPQDDARPHFRFIDGTSSSGLVFRHVATRTPEKQMPEIMGGGVVIADFNRDGAPDVVFINSGDLRATQRPEEASTRLFMNDGQGHFTDQTNTWNLPSAGYGMGAAAGDYDGDGWCDLFLTTYAGPDMLLRNTGGKFEDVTESTGIVQDERWSTSAAFFDLENDGDLDLYVVRYVDYRLKSALKCYSGHWQIYCTPILFDAVPDRLLRNNGNGTFSDATSEMGWSELAGKGLAIASGDIDLDGDSDLYIANDTSRNFLLVSDGAGRLADQALYAGVAYSDVGAEQAGMGTDFGDVNGDGRMDIVCTNFQTEPTSLYVQGSGFYFQESADALGIGATSRERLSFGVDLFDADNDGDEDLLVANGHIEDNIREHRSGVSFEQLNTLFENIGDGRFRDATAEAGPALATPAVNRGLATGDLDGDGDQDFIVMRNDGPALVGMKESPTHGNFVSLWLEGQESNRSAIGAVAWARVRGHTVVRQVMGGSSYLSANDPRIHIGLGDSDKADDVTIQWPGGKRQTIGPLAANRFYYVRQGAPAREYRPGEKMISPEPEP